MIYMNHMIYMIIKLSQLARAKILVPPVLKCVALNNYFKYFVLPFLHLKTSMIVPSLVATC